MNTIMFVAFFFVLKKATCIHNKKVFIAHEHMYHQAAPSKGGV